MGKPKCDQCPLHGQKGLKPLWGQLPEPGEFNGLVVLSDQPTKSEIKEGKSFVGQPGRLILAVAKRAGFNWESCCVLHAISCFSGKPFSVTSSGSLSEKGKAEQAQAVECCRPYWEDRLREYAPKAILALGGVALRALQGPDVGGTDEVRGTVQSWNGIPLLATEHPTRTLNGKGFSAEVLVTDVWRVGQWLHRDPEPWKEEIILAPGADQLRSLVEEWRAEGGVAVDVETIPIPKNRWFCPLRSIGLGGKRVAVSVPYMAHEWPKFYSESEFLEVRQALREIFLDHSCSKLYHNMQFDLPVLLRHGFENQGRCEDTMVAHHCLYQRGVLHRLQYAASMFLELPAWKSEFKKEWEAPFPVLGRYNARDCLVTARLWERLYQTLVQQGSLPVYLLELWNTEIAWRMSREGIWVDQYAREEELEKYRRLKFEKQFEVLALSGVPAQQIELSRWYFSSPLQGYLELKLQDYEQGARPDRDAVIEACERVREVSLTTEDINGLTESLEKLRALPRSTELKLEKGTPESAERRQEAQRFNNVVKSAVRRVERAINRAPFISLTAEGQMGVLFHDRLKLPRVAPPNKDGTYQTSETALYHLSREPIVKAWQEWKSHRHRLTWLEALPVVDGVIHQTYKSTTTPSARYASGSGSTGKDVDPLEKFNAQNPEKDLIRIFSAPPGFVLVAGDVSGIELRTAAAISDDQNMKRQIREFDGGICPYDMHSLRAISLWADWATREKKEKDLLRGVAKSANFLIIYGGGAEKLRDGWRVQLPPAGSVEEQEERDLVLLSDSKKLIQSVRRDWAGLVRFLEHGYQQALKTGRLKTGYATGAELRFPLRDPDHVGHSECFNYPVQRTARELVIGASYRINRRLPSYAKQVADMHDQLTFLAPEDKADRVAEIVREEMNFDFMGVRIRTDVLIGRTWKDVK